MSAVKPVREGSATDNAKKRHRPGEKADAGQRSGRPAAATAGPRAAAVTLNSYRQIHHRKRFQGHIAADRGLYGPSHTRLNVASLPIL